MLVLSTFNGNMLALNHSDDKQTRGKFLKTALLIVNLAAVCALVTASRRIRGLF